MDSSAVILVVDDMEGMRRIIVNSLIKMGLKNVLLAVNGLEAWRLLEGQPVDMVISDWNMPVMSGLELLQRIRATPRVAKLPVLMMTAETERHQVELAINAGVSGYMVKPFSMATLEAKLKKLMSADHAALAAGAPAVPVVARGKGAMPFAAVAPTLLEAGQGPKPTLLVVDDLPDNLDVLVELLSGDYQVKVANSGERALKILASGKPPDLILLDVMMPGMDGFEVCHRIKQNPTISDIPLIFLTAITETVDVARGFAAGAVDFIHKPAEPPILRARIATHLKLRRAFIELKRNRVELIERNAVLEDNIRLRDEVERIAQHDLKGPVAGIISFSEHLISDAGLAEEHRQIVQYIEQSAYRVLDLVNLSLDLHKMERGSYEFHPSRVDLAQVIERVVREAASELLVRQIELIRTLDGHALADGHGAPAAADDLLCYSMFGNLIRNAMEAAPEQSSITIAMRNEPGWVEIALGNSGAVPAEIRDIFFDKFSTAGKSGGTGLGTFSARLMATTQGGDIHMQTSDDPAGTIVTVRLPAAPGAA